MTQPNLYSPSEAMARVRQYCRGMSPGQVARAIGAEAETVRRSFAGKHDLSVSFLAKFCAATGVSADWVIHGTGPRPAVPERPEIVVKPLRGKVRAR
jgi:transcriptional regulator with XRE-family HTH domain